MEEEKDEEAWHVDKGQFIKYMVKISFHKNKNKHLWKGGKEIHFPELIYFINFNVLFFSTLTTDKKFWFFPSRASFFWVLSEDKTYYIIVSSLQS